MRQTEAMTMSEAMRVWWLDGSHVKSDDCKHVKLDPGDARVFFSNSMIKNKLA